MTGKPFQPRVEGTSEDRRLAVLRDYDILDTPPEPEFDDIVLLARVVCAAPVALISLVEKDRQWFKARAGLEARETPIDQSICFHGLRESAMLVIPDLTVDERTRRNSLVTGEPGLRFYAGAVLRGREGEALGMLCVVDYVARPAGLTTEQEIALKALGRQTVALLESRRAMRKRDAALLLERQTAEASLEHASVSEAITDQLQTEKSQLQRAQEAGHIGLFEMDLATEICRVSPEFCRIMGLPVRASYHIDELQTDISPEDRHLPSNVNSRRDGTASRDIEFRLKRPHDPAPRWIARRADFQFDATGKPAGMLGVVWDISARKQAEVRQAALIRLGDELRDATTLTEVVATASLILGETLGVSRAGYATIDVKSDEFTVNGDWVAPRVCRTTGSYSLSHFRRTTDRLAKGEPIAVVDNDAAAWVGDDIKAYNSIGVKSRIEVPLIEHGQLVGVLFVHGGRPRDWSGADIDFVDSVADRTYAAVAKVKAEDEQRFINQELIHRLKNTLAIVQAIAHQTFRGSDDKAALKSFNARLNALGKAHDVLTQRNWGAARINSIVEKVLDQLEPTRVDVLGPSLVVGPKAALSMALLLHELSTNALKYGSLSAPDGRVSIRWSIERSGPEPLFALSWKESGGPAATAPIRKGFGTRLIQMGLSGTGDAELRYEHEGLIARFQAPLPQITAT
jgi:two-component sensor histidine kinase/PAS domain-containing protein